MPMKKTKWQRPRHPRTGEIMSHHDLEATREDGMRFLIRGANTLAPTVRITSPEGVKVGEQALGRASADFAKRWCDGFVLDLWLADRLKSIEQQREQLREESERLVQRYIDLQVMLRELHAKRQEARS